MNLRRTLPSFLGKDISIYGVCFSELLPRCLSCVKYIVVIFFCFNVKTRREAEYSSKARSPAHMRTFKESEKSQKTVKSMIETKGGDKGKDLGGKKNKNTKKEGEYGSVCLLRRHHSRTALS